jgi:ADP-heptose:LPS heptosyltransferase
MNRKDYSSPPLELASHDKILIIQFKYLGDAVFITPALKALKSKYPNAEIHLLVAEEAAPLFENSSLIKKVWALPRIRGKARLLETWPFIQHLRKEKFKVSIDFAGNDRGGIFSLLISASLRIGPKTDKSNLIKKLSYTNIIKFQTPLKTWVARNVELLKASIKIDDLIPKSTYIESDPSLIHEAKLLLGKNDVICHLGTSQQRKEWPVKKWAALYQLASKTGYKLAFSAGPNPREQQLLEQIKTMEPNAFILPSMQNLSSFLAVLNEAKLVISGDTGPLHFAAGLGKKVIGLFAVDDGVQHYAPIYAENEVIIGKQCKCTGELVNFPTCQSPSPCMHSISAEQVFERLTERYPLGAA